jgi:hypothetical protein
MQTAVGHLGVVAPPKEGRPPRQQQQGSRLGAHQVRMPALRACARCVRHAAAVALLCVRAHVRVLAW